MSGICNNIVTFLKFISNSEESRSQIPDAEFVELIFSLIVTFFVTKPENRTRKSQTHLSHYCCQEKYYFRQKGLIFEKMC